MGILLVRNWEDGLARETDMAVRCNQVEVTSTMTAHKFRERKGRTKTVKAVREILENYTLQNLCPEMPKCRRMSVKGRRMKALEQ